MNDISCCVSPETIQVTVDKLYTIVLPIVISHHSIRWAKYFLDISDDDGRCSDAIIIELH